MSVGSRIKKVRELNNLTQKEFSEIICVTQSYISRVETDKETPTDMLIKLISLQFNISYAWLMDNSGDMDAFKGYDYFDRGCIKNFHIGAIESLDKFSNILRAAPDSEMDMYFIAIFDDFKTFLDMYKNDKRKCTLTLDVWTSVILAFSEAIYNIERLDKTKPDYLKKLYRQIRITTEVMTDLMNEICRFYEEGVID